MTIGAQCTITAAKFTKSNQAGLQIFTNLAWASREFIPGLFNLKPPGTTRGKGTAEGFGDKSVEYSSNVIQSGITGNANKIFGNETIAEVLRRLNCEVTFTDMWFFYRYDKTTPANNIIMIPDTEGEPDGFMEINSYDPQAAGVGEHWKANFEATVSIGLIETTIQAQDDGSGPDIGFTATTITAASTNFSTIGFKEGMKVYIDDLAGISGGITNAGRIVTIASGGVASGVLTLVENDLLVDAVGASTVVLRAGYKV
jgi:hypothetical protein